MAQTTGDLVRAAATGDRTAFEELVSQHAAMVTGVAYSRCGDFSLSEDIAQDAFIEAWKNLASIHEPEKFPGWICTIARRRAIDAVRTARSRRAAVPMENMALEVEDHNQLTPEAVMSMQQESELVWSMLARLPEAYREPMILFYRCEESTRDVAIALGESEPTIRQRLKRGRDMLRTEMTESIRAALGATVPKAAFAAMVMASLPSASYATGAAATTATAAAAKANGAVGAAAASAFGGAVMGSLIGIAGGIFGTWMSWKNCEYESQQKFVLHQARQFVVGFVVFGILLATLVTVRLQGRLADDFVYGKLLVALLLVSQVFNFAWIWRGIQGYKQVADEAKRRGEPIRPSMQQQLDAVRQQTQVWHPDGSVSYEAFRWNIRGWFGSCVGCTAWMIPLSSAAFWYGAIWLGVVTGLCFLVANAFAVLEWRLRERIEAYRANQHLVVVMCLLTIITLTGIQFLGNAETQEFVQWSPWAWCILFLFPLLSLQFWWMRRSFHAAASRL